MDTRMREYDGCDYPMSLIFRCTVKLQKIKHSSIRHTRSEERTVWYPWFAWDTEKWIPACASKTIILFAAIKFLIKLHIKRSFLAIRCDLYMKAIMVGIIKIKRAVKIQRIAFLYADKL